MKKVVLMGVPHHNNLGDHAIVLAEREYIEDNFKEYEYYEVDKRTAVWKHGRERGTERLLTGIEKHKHEKRVKSYIENAAEHNSDACLHGTSLRTDKVREKRVKGGDYTADDYGNEHIFTWIAMYLGVSAAEKINKSVHK